MRIEYQYKFWEHTNIKTIALTILEVQESLITFFCPGHHFAGGEEDEGWDDVIRGLDRSVEANASKQPIREMHLFVSKAMTIINQSWAGEGGSNSLTYQSKCPTYEKKINLGNSVVSERANSYISKEFKWEFQEVLRFESLSPPKPVLTSNCLCNSIGVTFQYFRHEGSFPMNALIILIPWEQACNHGHGLSSFPLSLPFLHRLGSTM